MQRLTKYEAIYKLPIVNGTQEEIGKLMAERMVYNAASVKGTLMLGSPNRIVLSSPEEVIVPITGIASGANVVNYGGQSISKIKLTPAQALPSQPRPGNSTGSVFQSGAGKRSSTPAQRAETGLRAAGTHLTDGAGDCRCPTLLLSSVLRQLTRTLRARTAWPPARSVRHANIAAPFVDCRICRLLH